MRMKNCFSNYLKNAYPQIYFRLHDWIDVPRYIWQIKAEEKNSINNGEASVFIVGSPRSGTSFAARALKEAGLVMIGPFTPADSFNSEGYWENVEVVHINQTILEASGGHWFWPPEKINSYKHQKLRIRLQLLKMKNASGVTAWKDPRASLTLDLWLDEAERCNLSYKVVGVFRHPESMAMSVLKHEKGKREITKKEVIESWIKHNRNLLNWSDMLGDCFLWVNFDQIPEELERNLKYVSRNLRIKEEAIDLNMFKASLKHHRYESIENQEASHVYDMLQKKFSEQALRH